MAWTSVLVADPQRLVGEAIASALDKCADLFVRKEVPTSAPDAVEAVKQWRPDVLLLDYWIGEMEAPAAIRQMVKEVPQCRIIVLSWFHGAREIQNCMDAGAVGFLPKSINLDQLGDAIRQASAGVYPVFPQQLKRMVKEVTQRTEKVAKEAELLATLTPREIYVIKALASGRPLEDLARELLISLSTLKVHIRHILRKTQTRTHAEAVAMALRNGWIQV